jgi:hypothetical protein
MRYEIIFKDPSAISVVDDFLRKHRVKKPTYLLDDDGFVEGVGFSSKDEAKDFYDRLQRKYESQQILGMGRYPRGVATRDELKEVQKLLQAVGEVCWGSGSSRRRWVEKRRFTI